jgi:hypothetical protein
VVREPVEQGGGHLGIGKHRWPFGEGQVGGDDDRGALVEGGTAADRRLARTAGSRVRRG